MSKTTIPLTLALALALGLTGCIQNMAGLKDSLGATEDALDATGEALNATSAALNATSDALANMSGGAAKKAPVARMSLFGGNGALVFKSTFQADDPADIIMVDAKSKLSAIAGESETLEKGATITAYAWTLNGKAIEGASKATVEVADAGLYTLVLTITDSNGQKDSQTVKLGVMPEPYDVVSEVVTSAVAGVEATGQSGAATFDLALDESKGPVTIQSVAFGASPPATCVDLELEVRDANGELVGSASGSAQVEAGELPVGAYTLTVVPYGCLAPDGVPVTVTVTYLPVVPGLDAAGGHGGHAGH